MAREKTRRNSFSKDPNDEVISSHEPEDDDVEQDTNDDLDLFAKKLFNQDMPHLTQNQMLAEQEYILQNMVKGAIKEAYKLANNYTLSIVVRPTSCMAHMANESGHPTKPQEIKNKTSKIDDTFLNLEIKKQDIGAVVHYKPFDDSSIITIEEFDLKSDNLWKQWESKMLPSLKRLFPEEGFSQTHLEKLKELFNSRSKEYLEENPYYTGKFSDVVYVEGPFLYLRDSPGKKIYGDHDLFCFADEEGDVPLQNEDTNLLKQLKKSKRFQAQHGCIYYWRPESNFEVKIKKKIMSAHTVDGGEPLLVISPKGGKVCFYEVESEQLISVWSICEKYLHNKGSNYSDSCLKWLLTTHSGCLWLLRTSQGDKWFESAAALKYKEMNDYLKKEEARERRRKEKQVVR